MLPYFAGNTVSGEEEKRPSAKNSRRGQVSRGKVLHMIAFDKFRELCRYFDDFFLSFIFQKLHIVSDESDEEVAKSSESSLTKVIISCLTFYI